MDKKRNIKKIYLLIIAVVIGVFMLFFLLRPGFKVKEFDKKLTINYNTKFEKSSGKICYGNNIKCKDVKIKVDGKVNTNKLGKYKLKYTYTYKGKEYVLNQVVEVKDIEAPKIDTKDRKVYVCPNGKIQDFKYNVTDNFDKEVEKNIKKEYDKEKNKVIISVKDSSKNKAFIELDAVVEDKKAPVITLNGGDKIFVQGYKYDDEGASAVDNCDDKVQVEVKSDVDYNKPGTYHISYSSKDSSGNEATVQRKIEIKSVESGHRIVYLTFDDGPSTYTNYLLDILKRYNVKVTFFVTGNGSDDSIARAYKEGHKIALHTNSHDYSYVYSSIDNYFADLNAISDRVKRITGESTNLIRFPGGSSNTVSKAYDGGIRIMSRLSDEVQNRGYHYFDWNVSSGDGGGELSTDEVYYNVISTLKEGSSVVLQHDTKKWSIDAVPRIIEYCQSNGYTFSTLSENSPGMHHGISN